jgi:hypothetical protein
MYAGRLMSNIAITAKILLSNYFKTTIIDANERLKHFKKTPNVPMEK